MSTFKLTVLMSKSGSNPQNKTEVVPGDLKSKTWFVPLAEIRNPRGALLQFADTPVNNTDQYIKQGMPFSIKLETFCINGRYDSGNDNNDLLVRSWVKYADKPRSERYHFFRKDVTPGEVVSDLQVGELVYVCVEHETDDNIIQLRFVITEIDRGLDTAPNSSILVEIASVASKFGSIFSPLLPFVAETAPSLVGVLSHLFNRPEENTDVFQVSLEFSTDAFNTDMLMRCGCYILFKEEIDGRMYRLRERKLIPSTNQPNVPSNDYIVISVIPRALVGGGDIRNEQLNQELAAVISELDVNSVSKKQDKDRQSQFAYLREIVKKTLQFDDVIFYLQNYKQDPRKLSDSQRKRLERIKADPELRKYLSGI